MIGLNGQRVYLDWNATAPLRPEARAAMLEAMDVVGNPSSVHAEGRAAKTIIEKARGQVGMLIGRSPDEVIFTSGATEGIATVCQMGWKMVACADVEHEAVLANAGVRHGKVMRNGEVDPFPSDEELESGVYSDLSSEEDGEPPGESVLYCFSNANGETGVLQDLGAALDAANAYLMCDLTQAAGKLSPGEYSHWDRVDYAVISGHKFGGPKGIASLITSAPHMFESLIPGGGQEQGYRSGTENVIGIAGIGAAAESAQRDLESGGWEQVEKLRNILESCLADAAGETIFFGQESPRLPNTSCFAVPGWKGETQVMQMDLAGFAVSAGSACSSGKVNKASRVLRAMGFDEITASSAIRVSMGPTTTEAEVMAFADTWIDAYRRRRAQAA